MDAALESELYETAEKLALDHYRTGGSALNAAFEQLRGWSGSFLPLETVESWEFDAEKSEAWGLEPSDAEDWQHLHEWQTRLAKAMLRRDYEDSWTWLILPMTSPKNPSEKGFVLLTYEAFFSFSPPTRPAEVQGVFDTPEAAFDHLDCIGVVAEDALDKAYRPSAA